MKIEYWKSAVNGRWYFHIRARNGKLITQSAGGQAGGYSRKGNMMRVIAALKKGMAKAKMEQV